MKINFDEGYQFGLGVYETIAVEKGELIFFKEHIQRMENALSVVGLRDAISPSEYSEEIIKKYVRNEDIDIGVVKISISEENVILTKRENQYTDENYENGYRVGISKIMRNESSPFTYIKSLNCGDNNLASRQGYKDGYDEVILLNSRGEITEGARTNIFFVKGNEIFTPPISSGLLNGIMRDHLIRENIAKEKVIFIDGVHEYDEIFLSNSVMKYLPVSDFCGKIYEKHTIANKLYIEFKKRYL